MHYKEAAKQGNGNAMARMGYYYRDGRVVSKSMQKAFDCFAKAANSGYAEGYLNLGIFYRFGKDPFEIVEKDNSIAIEQFNRALDCEDSYAYPEIHSWLAYCYYDVGDLKKMIEHFKIAANSDIADAQYQLYICYRDGIGVKANQQESKKWYKKAIENGYNE